MCDVVTTHTARKTFTNSNYIETQDQNMISKMTGHSKNSRAFDRYRDIDLDMLRKQVAKAFEKKEI
jgi:integrase